MRVRDAQQHHPNVSADAVRRELAAILNSPEFTSSPQLSGFLHYVVEHALAGDSESVKEYSIGVEVFGRGDSFDPRTDTIVRVQARRVRAKLKEYYATEGRADPVVIEVPKGHYVPKFRLAPRTAAETPKPPEGKPAPSAPPGKTAWNRQRIGAAAIGAAAAGATVWLLALSFFQPSGPVSGVIPLTTLAGAEFSTSWSPDGKFLAINRIYQESFDVFVLRRESGDLTRLTDSPADDFCPRWSPDGRWIAYLSDEGAGKNVYVLPPTGGPRQLLAETNVPFMERFDDTYMLLGNNPWSPDGQELLFSRLQLNGRIAVWKVRLDTGQLMQITAPPPGDDDFQGAWSFDGKSMVLVRRHANKYGLWLLPQAAREPEPLLADDFDHTHPVWAPDNERIVFESTRSGSANLWEIRVPSRKLRQLTTGPGGDRRPIISKQGELAYTLHQAQQNLYLRNIATGAETQLTYDTRRSQRPRLSPDGKRVAYQSNRGGNFDIWILDLPTGHERQLTSHPADDHTPEWSSDGRRIVFASDREGERKLWLMSAAGGPVQKLTDRFGPSRDRETGGGAGPKWSPDSKLIGCVAPSGRGEALWIVDLRTLAAKPVLFGVADFAWFRDSRHVVYAPTVSAEPGIPLIKVMNLETTRSRVLLEAPNRELAVAPNGSAVTFVGGRSHENFLFLLRLGESEGEDGLPAPLGPPEQLTDGGDVWHAHNGGWSSDGKSIVYVRDIIHADIYLLGDYR